MTLQSADILGVSMGASKPHWPMITRPHLEWSRNDNLPSFSLKDLGQSFPALVNHGITDQAASLFQEMADLTKVIDAHCRGVKVISNMPAFIVCVEASYSVYNLFTYVSILPLTLISFPTLT